MGNTADTTCKVPEINIKSQVPSWDSSSDSDGYLDLSSAGDISIGTCTTDTTGGNAFFPPVTPTIFTTGAGTNVWSPPDPIKDILDRLPQDRQEEIKKLMEILGIDPIMLVNMAVNLLLHHMKKELKNEL